MRGFPQKLRATFFLAALMVLLSACELSLAQDITPPPGAELSAEVATSEPLVFPEGTPNLESGQILFAQSCAACHGLRGLGDGEQAGQLPVAVPAIGDPQVARQRSPHEWYQMISQGNLDRFMPPFSGSLSPQDRWDVLAYVYSLSAGMQDLQDAAEAYSQSCAACHGLEGRGDGPQAGELQSALPDFSHTAAMASRTQADFFGAVAQGVGEEMQAFPELSEEQIWALAAYVQSLALAAVNEASPFGELPGTGGVPSDVEAPETLSLRGQVTNGSEGALPFDAEITLHVFDQLTEVANQSGRVNENGGFEFEKVPSDSKYLYFAALDYAGLTFFSDLLTLGDALAGAEFSLTIYERSTDTSPLVAERIHLVFDFPSEGRVQVVQQVLVSNNGDNAIAPDEDGPSLLQYPLPPEASNLTFEQGALGERYEVTDAGFGDRRPVLPGQNSYQVLFAFEQQYTRSLTYRQEITLPTQDIYVFLPRSDVELRNDEFSLAGQQVIEGITYLAYHLEEDLAVGDEIVIELRGRHPLGGNAFLAIANDDSFLLGLIALTLAVAVLWLSLRQRVASSSAPASPETLMDAIADLDERHASGGVSGSRYQRERAALKERLRRALEEKDRN